MHCGQTWSAPVACSSTPLSRESVSRGGDVFSPPLHPPVPGEISHSLSLVLLAPVARADDPTRVFSGTERPPDHRLTDKPRDLNGYFPFAPPATKEAWDARRQALRTQLQVALGLWPMPERGPVRATVH